mgnify:FL=1
MGARDFADFCTDNQEVITELVERFSDYEPTGGLDDAKLSHWLKQFQPQHRELALKVAESIHYYGIHEVNKLMATMHKLVVQQIEAGGAAANDVSFVPLGITGESGEDIARRYRNVNGLHGWRDRFVKAAQLPERIFQSKTPTVFFLDDFIGTGDQVVGYWEEVLSQLVPDYIGIYLVVVAAMPDGARRIESATPIRVLPVHTVPTRHQILSGACQRFSPHEKRTVCHYCDKIGNKPMGYGDCGLLLSFAYGTPNNSVSVIRGSKGQRSWRGLLPGWEDLQD